jgi:nucleotide-binding universal stress UspA family protein
MLFAVIDPSAQVRRVSTSDGPGLVAVALDGDSAGWRAFSWALGHARRSRCPILALYIGSPGRMLAAMAYAYPITASVSVDEEVRRSEAIVADEVRHQAECLGAEFGVAVRFALRPGASLRALLSEAEQAGADLLVIGASRKTSRGVPRQRLPVVIIP